MSTSAFDVIKKSVITRLFIIGFLTLIFLIPIAMIYSIINERESRRNAVTREINSKWALEQTVSGPVLGIPYKDFRCEMDGNERKKVVKEEKKIACFLPDHLIIAGHITPEFRTRGIYKSAVYTAGLEIKGEFTFPDFKSLQIPGENILWDEATLSFGITDMRGISRNIRLEWDQHTLSPKPGIPFKYVFANGISTPVPLSPGDPGKKESQSFSMTLQLRGSQNISFLPLGRKTEAHISSTWKSPSFSGAFLPQNRIINEKGFEAQWEIFEYNRQYPQQWANTSWNFYSSSFGIDFFIPVDEYQKITRSIKYSILFISLTFLAFFVFFELFNKKRIHPIQYLLVGLALCLFYLLLVSLSEHMAFDKAYGISGFGIIALTTIYTWSMSQKRYLSVLMGMIITGLYGFLYVTLSMEDYALLMGSMGLFVILAVVMIGTRKIDWYSFKMGTDSRLPVAADNGLKVQDSTLD